jgi:hypothetical protein
VYGLREDTIHIVLIPIWTSLECCGMSGLRPKEVNDKGVRMESN